MRSVTVAVLFFLVAVCGARAQEPQGSSGISQIDVTDYGRNICLMDQARFRLGMSQADLDRCPHINLAQQGAVDDMANKFCRNPEAFCDSFLQMQHNETAGAIASASAAQVNDAFDSAGGATHTMDRSRLFVSSRCESATMPRTTLTGPDKFGNTQQDTLFKTWSCTRAPVKAAEPHRLRYELSCDASKMPYDCVSHFLKEPQRNPSTALATSVEFERLSPRFDHGRCVMTVSDVPLGRQPRPPATCPDDDREACHAISERFDAQLQVIGNRLYGLDTKRFAEDSRRVLSQTMPNGQTAAQMADDKFRAAKAGVVSYLNSIGAPPEVIAMVEKTTLISPTLFLKPHPTVQDQLDMAEVEQDCTNNKRADGKPARKLRSFGDSNAFNGPVETLVFDPAAHKTKIRESARISICPSIIYDAMLGNPQSLLLALAHELGHSIDPCRLGRHFQAPADARCPLEVIDQPSAAVRAFRNGPVAGFRSCLFQNSQMARPTGGFSGSEVVPGNSRTYWQALADQDKKRPGTLNAIEKCEARANLGDLDACGSYPTLSQLAKLPDPAMRTAAIAEAKDPPHDKSEESYSDFIAANALPFAVEADNAGFARLNREDKRADLLTATALQCGPFNPKAHDFDCSVAKEEPCAPNHRITSRDSHTSGPYGISMFAAVPRTRQQICDPVAIPAGQKGNGTPFPSADCHL